MALTWEIPVSIDEASLGAVTVDEDDILPGRYDEDDDGQEDEGDE